MKIAITSNGDNLNAGIDPRFGRCKYFIIVDLVSYDFEAISNESTSAFGGAGIRAAENIAHKKVKAVLTGNIGPNAFQTLNAAGIKVFTGVNGSINDALEKFKKGEYSPCNSANVSSHYGIGGR